MGYIYIYIFMCVYVYMCIYIYVHKLGVFGIVENKTETPISGLGSRV